MPLCVSLPSVLVPDIESLLYQQQVRKHKPDYVADASNQAQDVTIDGNKFLHIMDGNANANAN